MGISTISLKTNGVSEEGIKEFFKIVRLFPVEEASDEKYFRVIPLNLNIKDIEIGEKGSNKTIVRFNERDFIVFSADEKELNLRSIL